jgi:hypothetical protein
MLEALLAILLTGLSGQAHTDSTGTIQGVVVNGSRSGEPMADTEVHLRAGMDGIFEPVDKTNTDAFGKFSFQDIPLNSRFVFLPGANHQGVHYPGQRMRFDAGNNVAQVKIVAYDAVMSVSPLTAERHDINIDVGERFLEITETLVVSNRSRATYVGQSKDEEAPVTLCLSVPRNFDRVTFDSEFYGRRFRIVDHQLVTDMPWPPGERTLKFRYRVPLEGSSGQFRRTLDMPSSNVRVQAQTQDQQVSCNLSPAAVVGGRMIFAMNDKQLPSSYIINVQIGDLPIPWMLYARRGSLLALIALVTGTQLVRRLHKSRAKHSIVSNNPNGEVIRRESEVGQRAKMARHFVVRAD